MNACKTGSPRVSVVMPTYNTERYVQAAVRSALDSIGCDVEVLVIDDCSTDHSVEEVQALGDSRVRVISISRSGGPSRPRNVGVANARAPYISLLDSDDLLRPEKLAACAAVLDRFPSAGFAFSDFEKMDSDGNVFEISTTYAYPVFRALKTCPLEEGWRLIPRNELARGLVHENFIGTSGVVVRKELIETLGGFDETLANGDDLDLWYRLAHRCDALYSPNVGHSYRVHSTSVIHGPPIRNALSRIRVLQREKTRWTDRQVRRHLRRRIAENLGGIGYQWRLQRKRWTAARTYIRAFLISPELRWLGDLLKASFFSPQDPSRL